MNPLAIKSAIKAMLMSIAFGLILALSSATVFAETDSTDPVLTAGAPLELVSSIPENGAVNVEPFSEISLTFNQNVVNEAVRETNAKAVTLWAGTQKVDVDIKLTDNLIDPEGFGVIHIVPKENLKTSQLYTIKVDTSLTSASGSHLQAPIESHFTTIQTTNSLPLTGVVIAVIVILVILAVIYIVYSKGRKR